VAIAKKILITTESLETFVLQINRKGRAFGHCVHCDREIEVLSIDQAVTVCGLSTLELIQKVKTNEIHGIETDSGHILVCRESLPERVVRKGEKI